MKWDDKRSYQYKPYVKYICMIIIEKPIFIKDVLFNFQSDSNVCISLQIDSTSFEKKNSYDIAEWNVETSLSEGRHFIELVVNQPVTPYTWDSMYDFLNEMPCIECIQTFGCDNFGSFKPVSPIIDFNLEWSS